MAQTSTDDDDDASPCSPVNSVCRLMRPVAAAIGSGSLSSLVFAVAREILRSDPPVFSGPSTDLCPLLDLPEWHLDTHSFAIGLLVGVALLPLLDFLILVRLSWIRWVRQTAQLQGSRLYRVVG